MAPSVSQLVEESLDLKPGAVQAGYRFDDLPGWDSLAVIQLLALLDKHFGVQIPAGDMFKLSTVADLAAVVDAARRLKQV